VIVVDVNVIAYFFIEGEKTALVRQMFERDRDWVAPELWKHEFLNILATYCKLGYLTYERCSETWSNAIELFEDFTLHVDMIEALKNAVKDGLSAYDAQYITLARSLRTKCVTEDRLLIRKFSGEALSIKDFLAIA
jgi:predicted nucleic acid-binding protein